VKLWQAAFQRKRSCGARELTQSKEDVSGDHFAEKNQHLNGFGVTPIYWSVEMTGMK